MSDLESFLETEDPELAELVAEVGERLRRGGQVRPEDHPRHAEALRELLPTIKLMADLPGVARLTPALGLLDDFRLLREVSRGGMGIVYEAVQVSLGRRVALKVLPGAAALDPRQLQRFHLEAQAAASLNHPHIVPVFATGSSEGMPYYAMRFIDGRDLARVIRELRRDELAETEADPREPGRQTTLSTQGISHAREAARLARQAAEALDHAHASDVVHRDIKPSNLMVDGSGDLWITDFGLARVRGGLDLTRTGDALGTPRYMSPEQALGQRTPIDGRTDIYSLGVTLYELLTLRPAFGGDDRLEVLRRIAQDDPTPPRKLDPSIPLDLETIVLKSMAKAPADRYATAAELAADLGRFLDNRPILARRPSLADRGSKWVRRHRELIATASVAAVILLMGLAGAALQYTSWLRRHNAALQAEVDRADRHARDAERHASEADRHRKLSDRHSLAAQLRLAQQAVEARQFGVAQDLLDECAPDPLAGERGDFAWHYLRRLARRELVRMPERSARLGALALSGDGKIAAAWYNDATIVVWDLASESPYRTIGPVHCGDMAISEDGRILAAEQRKPGDGPVERVTVWDTRTGRVLGEYALDPADRQRPSWIELLAGGRVLATRFLNADQTCSVRTRRVEGGPQAAPGAAGSDLDRLDSATFLPGADFFVTREGSRLRVRDAFTGAVRREPPGDFAGALEPAISADGRTVAAAINGDPVVVLDLAKGVERARRSFGTPIAVVRLSPDGDVLAGVEQSGLVHLWDLRRDCDLVIRPDSLESGRNPHIPIFSPDGGRIATSTSGNPGGRQPAAVWETATGHRLGVLPYADGCADLHGFVGTSRSLILSSNRSPLIWHFEPPADPPSPAGHKDEAWSAAYSPDGKILATGSDDTDEPDTIKLWDPATGTLIRGWNGGVGTVASLAFSPDGRILASGHLAMRDNVRLWDTATGRLLHSLQGHQDFVRSVAFAPDGRTLASAGGKKRLEGRDWTVRVWDVGRASCVRELTGHTDAVRSLAFSPDGRTLATVGNDQTVRLWDAATGTFLLAQRNSTALVALAYAPDGGTIATADETGVVTIRDPASLEVVRTIRGASDRLLSLAFAPDGNSLATCGTSGVIRLWDALTSQELLVLKRHRAQVQGIAFAPDGSSLASCSLDGEVKVWRAPAGR